MAQWTGFNAVPTLVSIIRRGPEIIDRDSIGRCNLYSVLIVVLH